MPARAGDGPLPVTKEIRWRHRFAVLTAATTVLLLGWGAFVTSINAGLAVPDWPSSFNSYDPFNPWPGWWKLTPILAEHGHRLLGALVGAFTLILAVWTWRADPRKWLKRLSVGALLLVSVQGVLGGLRVVLVSLDLAVVHACVAQIFFALIIGMAFFTSRTWLHGEYGTFQGEQVPRLRRIATVTIAVIYVQIILGALLRHPGTGIDPTLVIMHVGGALAASAAILALFRHVLRHHWGSRIAQPASFVLLFLLAVQFSLGVTAYFVTLDEAGMLAPSNLQVIVNTAHMVTGALLMGTAAIVVLDAYRLPSEEARRMETMESIILS